MSEDQLHQRWILERRTLRIENDCLAYDVQKPNRHFGTRVPFEKLPEHPSTLIVEQKGLLILGLLFAICGLIVAFAADRGSRSAGYTSFGLGGALYLAYRLTRRSYVVFEAGGENYLIFRNLPSKEVVDAFLQRLEERKKQFFEKRDSVVRRDTDAVSQIDRLVRLRRLGYIEDEEFLILKERIVAGAEQQSDDEGNEPAN